MTKQLRFVAFTAFVTGTAVVWPQSWYQGSDIKSGLTDTTGVYQTGGVYEGSVYKETTDPDFYVNAYKVVGGSNWDPNISISLGDMFNGQALGSLNTGQFSATFQGASFGSIDPSVALGVYDFKMQVLGGSTDTSMDELVSWDYKLDVHKTFNIGVTGSLSQDIVPYGVTADLKMTVENRESETVYSTTWFVSGGDDSAASFMDWNWDFNPGWFDAVIAPGGSETRMHSHYSPHVGTPLGTYHTYGGVVGGFHPGDWHWVKFEDAPSMTVVPEPTTLIGAFVGILAMTKLRRRGKDGSAA